MQITNFNVRFRLPLLWQSQQGLDPVLHNFLVPTGLKIINEFELMYSEVI